MKAFKEREAPKVDGVTYDNAPHDEFTYHQKASTKYGGSVGGNAL